jgi:hypothetical protein
MMEDVVDMFQALEEDLIEMSAKFSDAILTQCQAQDVISFLDEVGLLDYDALKEYFTEEEDDDNE